MPHLLIVESDIPAIERSLEMAGKKTSAGGYVQAFKSISDEISVEIIRPYVSGFERASFDFEAYDGFVFTGSSVAWSVDAPEALPLRKIMEATLKEQKPVFGSCNGLQLASVVLGGQCRAAPAGMEIGLVCNIKLNSVGRSHPLHHGRANSFCALSIHRDQVSKLPCGAVATAGNEHSPVQAMVYEQGGIRFWGTQYHPEYSLANIVDNVSDANSLFYNERDILTDIQSTKHNPDGEVANRPGANVNDLKLEVRQTELRNWLLSLDCVMPGTTP